MLKIITLLCCLTLPTFALSNSDVVERLKDLKFFLEELEIESQDQLFTDYKSSFKLSFELFAKAWAQKEATCFYGGWPSETIRVKGRKYCTSPKNVKHGYEQGSCSSNLIQCQPLLFGEGICVGFTSRSEKVNTFKNCEQKFKDDKRDYSFTDKFTALDLESLKEIENLAKSLCQKKSTSVPMCQKILNRLKKSNDLKVDLKEKVSNNVHLDDAPLITMTPDDEVSFNGEVPPSRPALSEIECNELIQDKLEEIEKLSADVASIVSYYGDDKKWPENVDPRKDRAIKIQGEVLCLELEVFNLSNNLDLDIDCTKNPKKLPPMHVSFIKHTDVTDLSEYSSTIIKKRVTDLNKRASKYEKDLNSGLYDGLSQEGRAQIQDNLEWLRKEAACLDKYPEVNTCPNSSTGRNHEERTISEIINNYTAGSPQLTMLVKGKNGKLMPFKTVQDLVVRPSVGPKIKQGDNMTPEGIFKLNAPSGVSGYFTSAKVDYENWTERNQYLKDLPASMQNPGDKGGDILVHGAGGSIGCLSLKNSDAAYFTALVKNKKDNAESLKISIYPAPMTDELVQSADKLSSDVKIYKSFWQKLKVNYENEQALLNKDVSTINEIYKDR
jgi:hypothetical protein